MLVLQAAIVLQLGHQVEHVAQMMQMHVDGQPPALAHGLLGQLDLEWVHFGMTLGIGIVAVIALWRWPTNPFAWLLMPLAFWHLAEHSVILTTYLRTGITGTAGILARGGLLNGPLSRPDLHFLYNAAVLVLLVGAWAWQRRRGTNVRERLARVPALGMTLGVAAGLSLIVLSSTPVQWVAAEQSLQDAINRAPSGSVVHLRPGLYAGPLLIDRPLTLIGPATIVGGPDRAVITIAASGVSLSDLDVRGGDTGVLVTRATRVNLENIAVTGAARRGIDIVQSSAQIHGCRVTDLTSQFAWGIGIVNSGGRAPTTVQACRVAGVQEGIVSHVSSVFIRDNDIRKTATRGIAVTEMSSGDVERNRIEQASGTGLYCGDRSICYLRANTVKGISPDLDSPMTWSRGYGAVLLFGADAYMEGNVFIDTAMPGVGVFVKSTLHTEPIQVSMP
jgi:parallel beta helix pectate lyase-like protein